MTHLTQYYFTKRARRTLAVAQAIAEQLAYPNLHGEHVLLALLRSEGSVARHVLLNLGLNEAQVALVVLNIPDTKEQPTVKEINLGADVRNLLELVVESDNSFMVVH